MHWYFYSNVSKNSSTDGLFSLIRSSKSPADLNDRETSWYIRWDRTLPFNSVFPFSRHILFVIGYRQDYWEQAASEICGNWVTGIFCYSRNTPPPTFPATPVEFGLLCPLCLPKLHSQGFLRERKARHKGVESYFLMCPRLYLSATVLVW